MRFLGIILLSLSVIQTASASFQFREFNFEQINCMGHNGVSYQITDDSGEASIKIETALGAIKKTFYGNFFVSPANELHIEMGTHRSGYIQDYHIYLLLPPVVTGTQYSTGTVIRTNYAMQTPIGPINCKIQYAK